MSILLRASGLTTRYGDVVALDRADFEIEDTVTGLLGPGGRCHDLREGGPSWASLAGISAQ